VEPVADEPADGERVDGGSARSRDAGDPDVPEDERRSDEPGDEDPGEPLRFDAWRRRSATGAVLTGIALGLQQALTDVRDPPAIVLEAQGEPEDPDAPIDLRFDPDDPAGTVAIIRDPARGREDGAEPS
jgi:hypothetical protein